jgi:3-hydroxymyristoyl/3-hydroxydecanoyl-(acyl carrier protein) dehydratase
VTVTVPPDCVYFRGHFEGMPMLPGVAQLTAIVLPAVRERHPECGVLVSIRRLRFHRPLLPGETVEVTLGGNAPDDVRFALRVGSARVATGMLSFGKA